MERGISHMFACARGSPTRAAELAALGGRAVVPAFAELLDDLGAERRQVVGLAARHEALVDDDLLVDPGAAGVADVGLQRRPRRDRAALQDVRLDERPRPVT